MNDEEFLILYNKFREACNSRKFSTDYEFINRSKKNKKLLIIVAGYQEYLWECVFQRINKFLNNDIDVCLTSPGLYNDKLVRISEKYGWSYLSLKEDKLALAQNIAIKLHENAEYIYKNDEDIFICDGYFDDMLKLYNKFLKDDEYLGDPCFVAPCININAFSYINFLEKIDKISEYEKLFGKAKYSFEDIWKNAEAAKFIWQNSLPLDEKAKKLFTNTYPYKICPMRFSIGAIMFKRSIWEKMGGFRVYNEGVLGMEEGQMVEWAVSTSHPIVVSEDILVGHLGYFNQKESMKKFFKDNKKKFNIVI